MALSFLPYNFLFLPFAIVLFIMGLGSGLFTSPNIASIMNSVPPEHRGAASGMRATLQNSGQTISTAVFFTIIISALAKSLPGAFTTALTGAGAAQLATAFAQIPPTGALFAAFLGYNPVGTMLSSPQLAGVVGLIPQSTIATLEGTTYFPNAIAKPFMSALDVSFYIGAALSFAAAVASVLRGERYVPEAKEASEESVAIPTARSAH